MKKETMRKMRTTCFRKCPIKTLARTKLTKSTTIQSALGAIRTSFIDLIGMTFYQYEKNLNGD